MKQHLSIFRRSIQLVAFVVCLLPALLSAQKIKIKVLSNEITYAYAFDPYGYGYTPIPPHAGKDELRGAWHNDAHETIDIDPGSILEIPGDVEHMSLYDGEVEYIDFSGATGRLTRLVTDNLVLHRLEFMNVPLLDDLRLGGYKLLQRLDLSELSALEVLELGRGNGAEISGSLVEVIFPRKIRYTR